MSSTSLDSPWPATFTPPPRNTAPVDNPDDQSRSSSLYLFTFLSTLFLLLVVSTAIVLRSFLLRRRYRMGLQEQLDDLFRQPADPSGTSRRRNFGAKPKLWDAWINPDDEEKHSVNGFADIKPLAVVYVPQETTKPQNSSPSSSLPQHHRHDRSSAFLAGLFAHPLSHPRHPPENDPPGPDSANSSSEIPRRVQLSVLISMPSPTRKKPHASDTTEEEFPNVAIGLSRLSISND